MVKSYIASNTLPWNF